MCGSLSRISPASSDIFVPLFTPQGSVWSGAASSDALYITTGIGSAPPGVLALPMPAR